MILLRTYGLIFYVICLFGFGATNVSGSDLDSLNNKIAVQLTNITDTTEVFKEAHLSLVLSNKENNEVGLISAYLYLARFHENYGQLDSAIYYFKELKNIYKKSGNNVAVAESCFELKGLYNAKAAYAESMKEVYEALALYEEKNIQEGIALCYTHICDLLYYENKYEESAEYCDKAIAIQEQLNAKRDLAVSYRYKASSLLFVDGELEQALETINNAIDIYNQLDETGIPLLACLNGRGNILKYMERYDDAIADYQYIYEKCVKIGLDRYTIPSIGNIGHVYILQDKYEEALPYMLEAIDLIKASGETKNLWESYMHVSNIYKELGDYKKAYEYHLLESEEYEKYLNSIIDRLESEAQIKYETVKKDEMINEQEAKIENQQLIEILYAIIAGLLLLSVIGMYRSSKKIRKKQIEIEKSKEELQGSLESLKATQAQLIHAEKMASLGELTAGIAHEIQNPLNFVKNFSEVNAELIGELKEEVDKGDLEEIKAIATDIEENEVKIIHHGKRADAIVKGMLQHSRSSSDEKELTNINELADEYLRLAYHGLRAKDKSFNADFKTNLDENLSNINVVPQDIGRVLLNLINNAFFAVNERLKKGEEGYKPIVSVTTFEENKKVEIKVTDNGSGIPDHVLDKIFQPFFTTKPTGEGTGLGLSMSYDIITKGHGGKLKVETIEGEGSTFIIQLNQ